MPKRYAEAQPTQPAAKEGQSSHSFHVALTGHRPTKLAGYDLSHAFYERLRARLVETISQGLAVHQHLTLHSGLALGADTVWSQAILQQRAAHPERIRFVADVPVMTQADQWPDAASKAFWRRQIEVADEVNVYAQAYTPRCMQLRNEGMVRPCGLLLAVWDGSPGGTANAVSFAEANSIRVHRMDPASFR